MKLNKKNLENSIEKARNLLEKAQEVEEKYGYPLTPAEEALRELIHCYDLTRKEEKINSEQQ